MTGKMRKKRGGKRAGAGRKPKLSEAEREEIAREYWDRKTAREAATALGRDPARRKRLKTFNRLQQKSERFADGRIPGHDASLFDAELRKQSGAGLNDIYSPQASPIKRLKGFRAAIIREIAEEHKGRGITVRMVTRCINEFDFGT